MNADLKLIPENARLKMNHSSKSGLTKTIFTIAPIVIASLRNKKGAIAYSVPFVGMGGAGRVVILRITLSISIGQMKMNHKTCARFMQM